MSLEANMKVLSNIQVIRFSEQLSRDALLQQMTKEAINKGWAKEGYTEAVITRENKYPTGLHTLGSEVAIPHADPDWTSTPAMVIGVLDHPVYFKPMGGQGDDVVASFVFLLVIPDAEAHLNFLQAFSTFLEDEEKLEELGRTKDINQLIDHLKNELVAINRE